MVFTRIGFYKGKSYAIKRLKTEKVEVTRSLKKDLKVLRDLKHENINQFIGASLDFDCVCIVSDYSPRGSLSDILNNKEMKLDEVFIASLVFDIIRGIIYLHDSSIGFHGNLKTNNCLVDSRWILKLTDFGHQAFPTEWPDYHGFLSQERLNEEIWENLLHRAPELLRSTIGFSEFTTTNLQKADAYSFSIIFYKLKTKPNHSTFGNTSLPPSQIISRLIEYDVNAEDTKPFRPRLETLPDDCGDWIKNILRDAWSENPNERPDFKVPTYED